MDKAEKNELYRACVARAREAMKREGYPRAEWKRAVRKAARLIYAEARRAERA